MGEKEKVAAGSDYRNRGPVITLVAVKNKETLNIHITVYKVSASSCWSPSARRKFFEW